MDTKWFVLYDMPYEGTYVDEYTFKENAIEEYNKQVANREKSGYCNFQLIEGIVLLEDED